MALPAEYVTRYMRYLRYLRDVQVRDDDGAPRGVRHRLRGQLVLRLALLRRDQKDGHVAGAPCRVCIRLSRLGGHVARPAPCDRHVTTTVLPCNVLLLRTVTYGYVDCVPGDQRAGEHLHCARRDDRGPAG